MQTHHTNPAKSKPNINISKMKNFGKWGKAVNCTCIECTGNKSEEVLSKLQYLPLASLPATAHAEVSLSLVSPLFNPQRVWWQRKTSSPRPLSCLNLLCSCVWESAHMELREGGHSLINISSGALVCPRALPSEPSSHSFCSCSRAAACEAQHHLWLLPPPRALLGRSESTREGERGGGVGGEKREGASTNQRWQAMMGLSCCQ